MNESTVGGLLRGWRQARRMTQMDLALQAEVSTRHVSFLETGRSRPSRQMLLVLSSVMELPLRDRNTLLAAAGFTPAYRETELHAPEMGAVRRALDFMLQQAEPYGAVVVDGCWNLLQSNRAATAFTAAFVTDLAATVGHEPPNLLRLLLHPRGVRDQCMNWAQVAQQMVVRVHRELAASHDARLLRIFEEVLSYEGVPPDWRTADVRDTASLLVPMHMRRGDLDIRLFTTITTLGTAQDITLQELRIESFFPADDPSDRQMRLLAAGP